MTTQAFRQRNSFYLRVGKTTVVPLSLVLHDPTHFTNALFHEIIQSLQSLLPLYLINVSTTVKSETEPEIHSSDNIRFTYKFCPTPRYCVVSRVQKSDDNGDNAMKEDDEVYEGGRYRGFTISRSTIEVETLPASAPPASSPPPQSSISKYFIAGKTPRSKQ